MTAPVSRRMPPDFDTVSKFHDLFLEDLLNAGPIVTTDHLKFAATESVARHAPDAQAATVEEFLKAAVDAQLAYRSVGEVGLSKRLVSALHLYATHVRRQTLSDAEARQALMRNVSGFSLTEMAIAELYATAFEGSVAFWTNRIPPAKLVDPNAPQPEGGPVNSSHVYTDWGCIALADAAGVVATTTMHGWAVMFFGATPVTGGAAALYLGLGGALASFTASQTGACNKVIGREDVPSPGETQIPDGDGGGRGPIA